MSAFLLALGMAAAQPAPEPYRARGNEPPWTLTIAAGRMRIEQRGGAAIDVRAPSPRSDEFSRQYRTGRLSVSVHAGSACTDRTTSQRYSDSVFVRIGDAELAGCGGVALATDDLTGTSWAFVETAGAAVTPTMSGDSLDIGAGHVMGYSRCNRFSARYARADGRLTFSWVGSTMTRCAPPHDAHDAQLRRIFSGRAGPVRMSLPDPDALLLSADVTVRLRRVDTRH